MISSPIQKSLRDFPGFFKLYKVSEVSSPSKVFVSAPCHKARPGLPINFAPPKGPSINYETPEGREGVSRFVTFLLKFPIFY